MTSDTDQPRQRTVAELLAEHGGGVVGGRRHRRRAAEDQQPGEEQAEEGQIGEQPAAKRNGHSLATSAFPAHAVANSPLGTADPAEDHARSDQAALPVASELPELPSTDVALGSPATGDATLPALNGHADSDLHRNRTPDVPTEQLPQVVDDSADTSSFDRAESALRSGRSQDQTEIVAAERNGRRVDVGLGWEKSVDSPTETDATAVLGAGADGVGAEDDPPTAAIARSGPRRGGEPAGRGALAEPGKRGTAPEPGRRGASAERLGAGEPRMRRAGIEGPARGGTAVPAPARQPDQAGTEQSNGRVWATVLAQWVGGALGGAAVWVCFRFLWRGLPVVALVAAVLVTIGLVMLVRALLGNNDARHTLLAVGVGLLLTVSPAILVLLDR